MNRQERRRLEREAAKAQIRSADGTIDSNGFHQMTKQEKDYRTMAIEEGPALLRKTLSPTGKGVSLRCRNISQKEANEICGSIFTIREYKKGEEILSTGSWFNPLRRGKAVWNFGSFGSIWSDLRISNGRTFRIHFLANDCTFGAEEMER